jgi:glycosyltransferase involved in cell wall biosynthesis
MQVSAIIPTFNEELTITKTLEALSRLVNVSEVIVVDGGSTDKTCEIVENFQRLKTLKLVKIDEANRGKQLHEGTKHASGDIFWFLYADTRPTQGSARQIKGVMKYTAVVGGNFEVSFGRENRAAKFMTWLYPYFISLGLCYGDSAFFIGRIAYNKVGGFKEIGAFEDVDMYHKLRKIGRFYHLSQTVTASSRRFENTPFVFTFARWSFYQVLYWFKIPPAKLAKMYLKNAEQSFLKNS